MQHTGQIRCSSDESRRPEVPVLGASIRHAVLPQALAIALSLSFTGCGQQTNPAPQTNSGLSTPPALQTETPSNLPDPQLIEAENLFATLTRPGVESNEWDDAHSRLLQLVPASVTVLEQKLKNGSDVERELAATTLALIGPEASAAVGSLEEALQDSSPFVQANAAAALLQWPEMVTKATPVLIQLLSSDDPQLRQLAAANLNSLGGDATPYVVQLKQVLAQENPPEVLTPVVELLGRIGHFAEPALPELQKIAFERPGEIGDSARSAIQLIQTSVTDEPSQDKTP